MLHPEPSPALAEPASNRIALQCEVEPPRHLLGALLLAIAGIWIAVPSLALAGGRPALPGLGIVGSCGIVALGGAQLLWALHLMLRRRTVIVEGATVRLVERGLGGVRSWREPLARYRGLHHGCRPVRHRDGWRLLHRLELVHPEPSRVVCLISTPDERRVAATARQWVQMTGLPVLAASPTADEQPDGGRDRQRTASIAGAGAGSTGAPADLSCRSREAADLTDPSSAAGRGV